MFRELFMIWKIDQMFSNIAIPILKNNSVTYKLPLIFLVFMLMSSFKI